MYFLKQIDAGVPIMVDWVDWAGHRQVVIGLDACGTESPYDDVLIPADPYDITDHYQDGYYTYPLGRFFDMWRDGPAHRKQNRTSSRLLLQSRLPDTIFSLTLQMIQYPGCSGKTASYNHER